MNVRVPQGWVYVDSFDDLRAKVDAARDEYVRALDEQSEVLQHCTGLPHPDGTLRIHRASQNVREALERYTNAKDNLTTHVLNRTHPDQSRITAPPVSQHPRTPLAGPLDVLLVEDNPGDRRLVEHTTAHGTMEIRLAVANNCTRALGILADDRYVPNLVIADMGVLEFGGVDLLGRCNPRGIPVVIFGGSMNPAHKNEALRLGAKEFVRKPSTLDEYIDAVWAMIQKWASPQSSVTAGTI
jgi:CheY-like chemotaxis protein